MEIERTDIDGGVELKLTGRLDATWSELVQSTIDRCIHDGKHVVGLEMSEVSYISSAGLRVLVSSYKQLGAIKGRLVVLSPSENVRGVLLLAGLDLLLSGTAEKERVKSPASGVDKIIPSELASFQHFSLQPQAVLHARVLGNPRTAVAGRFTLDDIREVAFGRSSVGLGIGAFGSSAEESAGNYGEFLAAGGMAALMPPQDQSALDYLIEEGKFVPTVQVLYGVSAEGAFSSLLRFETDAQKAPIVISDLAELLLEHHQGQSLCVVMLAETAALVGAWLRRSPLPEDEEHTGRGIATDFPRIRDSISFTAEPVYPRSLCIVVGVVTSGAEGPLAKFVRPLDPTGRVLGHFHAAAFPYSPLQKGRIDLIESIRKPFEHGRPLGLLHLINDWRDAQGAGESSFTRGAVWSSALHFV